MTRPRDAFIGFGGNVGPVRSAFAMAVEALRSDPRTGEPEASRIYRSEPWGLSEQPPFLNGVLRLPWSGSAEELLELCHEIETSAGRDRTREQRWGPRPLDLDLLLLGDEQRDSDELTLPHPRMTQRSFVLVPLAELAGSRVLPGEDRTIGQLAQQAEEQGLQRLEQRLGEL